MKFSDRVLKALLRVYAVELVGMAYRGILAREADSTGLAAYAKTLKRSTDLTGLLKELSYSDEFWEKSLSARAPKLVQAIYLGLLGREAEAEALESYAAKLAESHDLTPLLAEIACSDEHWEKTLDARASDLVRALFQGLLGREAEAEALESYAVKLAKSHDLTPLLAEITRSDEFWEKNFAIGAPKMVRAIYQGLLGREADPEGLTTHAALLTKTNDLTTLLTNAIRSDEFIRSQKKFQKYPNPAVTYETPTLVFLHLHKTGGTSMQNMLLDTYGQKTLYREHADTLYLYSPAELSAYSVFAGHFNYDSLAYIPRRHLSIFTFVREPKKRLISLYYFWHSHKPTHPAYHIGMKYANELPMESFFDVDEIKLTSGLRYYLWNHMTWAILGQRQWIIWQALLLAKTDKEVVAEIITATIRPVIRKRLREFIFVGLEEEFDQSVNKLFQILQRPAPEAICSLNTLEGNLEVEPNFKQTIEKQSMTSRLDAALDRLVQLDSIVYEEARKVFFERLNEHSEIRTST